jgi:hypothetical protein
MPGELVWVMRPGPVPDLTGPTTLELVQDGQVLFNDESARHVPLSNVVAAHPPAVEFAQQAESEWRSSERRVYTGVGMLGATLAAMGVSIAGIVKKDPRLIAGGIGGTALFFSLGWGFIASADSSGKAAETALMNGVDRYNDDYLRKAPAQH